MSASAIQGSASVRTLPLPTQAAGGGPPPPSPPTTGAGAPPPPPPPGPPHRSDALDTEAGPGSARLYAQRLVSSAPPPATGAAKGAAFRGMLNLRYAADDSARTVPGNRPPPGRT